MEHLIDQDVRNNSAWNQRYFCLAHKLTAEDSSRDLARVTLDREIEYTLGKIATCVDNESAWNYLRALVSRLIELDADDSLATPTYPQSVVDFCMGSLNASRDDECSPFLVAFLVDYNQFLCKNALKIGNLNEEKRAEISKLVKMSLEFLDSLANRLDTIRVNYWNFLASLWKQDFKEFL